MPTTEDVSDSFNVDVEEETDLGFLPDRQRLVACLVLDAVAATSTNHDDNKDAHDDDDKGAPHKKYFNARKWLEKISPPVIDFTIFHGSDFSDDDKENDAPIPWTIKDKVQAMEDEETHWTALDA